MFSSSIIIFSLFSFESFGLTVISRNDFFGNNNLKAASSSNNEIDTFLTYEEKMKAMKHLTFVSSNPNKIKEVNMILGGKYPWELRSHNFDLTEPQATPIEVSRTKCAQAALLCNSPVIVEDTSLCFNALNGLPGPYIKWFYESIGNEGLAKLLDGYEDKTAYAQCVLSFTVGPGQEIKTFVGCTDGTIVYPTGPKGFGWDPIFVVRSKATFIRILNCPLIQYLLVSNKSH